MRLDHVTLWVSDLDASLSFYEDGLGLERRDAWSGNGVENVSVGAGGGRLQLRYDPDRTTPVAPTRADVDHLAFGLDDPGAVDRTFDRVAAHPGAAVVADPHAVEPADAYAALVADPDEYTVELVASV